MGGAHVLIQWNKKDESEEMIAALVCLPQQHSSLEYLKYGLILTKRKYH